jgi:hypothetical protein
MLKIRIIVYIRLAAFLLIGILSSSLGAYADDPLCDGTLWTQMTQRAHLNGQQDISRVENLVYKPDSILEYSCLQLAVTDIPSHVSYYMTDSMINGLVAPMIQYYIYASYSHTFMGGRDTPGGGAAAAGFNCDAMAYVWQMAKCMHAGNLAPQDTLGSVFEFLGAPDTRLLPTTCTTPDAATMGNAPVAAASPIALTVQATGANCGAAIPTGTTVNISETSNTAFDNTFPAVGPGRKYNEKICANPACHYVPTGVNTGTCQPPAAAATP